MPVPAEVTASPSGLPESRRCGERARCGDEQRAARGHSGRIPALLTTSAHLATSARIKEALSSGDKFTTR